MMLEYMATHMQKKNKNESRHFHMNHYLGDSTGENLDDQRFGDAFLDRRPMIQYVKQIIDKRYFIKSCCSAKD